MSIHVRVRYAEATQTSPLFQDLLLAVEKLEADRGRIRNRADHQNRKFEIIPETMCQIWMLLHKVFVTQLVKT